MALPASGEFYERELLVAGVRIQILAEVRRAGTQLHLKDLAVYPVSDAPVIIGPSALLRALREDVLSELRAEGVHRVRVTGERLSGASPGRMVVLTIQIVQEPA